MEVRHLRIEKSPDELLSKLEKIERYTVALKNIRPLYFAIEITKRYETFPAYSIYQTVITCKI
jgi:hypothetical protein